MKFNIIVLIITLIICSYILISNCNEMIKESFENSENIMDSIKSSVEAPVLDMNPTEIQYDEPGKDEDGNDVPSQIITQYEKINTSNLYKNILLSDDIIIDPEPVAKPKFEILDSIIKDDNNRFRTIQFENQERELIPKPKKEVVNLKDRYSSNYIEIPMQERSLNMATHKHMYNNKIDIDDPIQDSYLPYSYNDDYKVKSVEQNNFEYIVISIFKNILNRNPTNVELSKYTQQMISKDIDESLLKTNLINTVEYRRNIKLQSNDVLNDLQYEHAKKDLLFIISNLYLQEINKEIPKGMLLPLKDIWIYFQGNQYLFRALLVHKNYILFENEIMESKLLTKSNLSRLIDKYFILYDLKMIANDIQRYDIMSRKQSDKLEDNEVKTYRKVDENDINTDGLYKKIEEISKKAEIDVNKIQYPIKSQLEESNTNMVKIMKNINESV